MATLRLGHDWELGLPLDDGEGGFGSVYEVAGPFEPAVAKLIPKRPGAERELLVPAELDGARNIVPVLDQGEHDSNWVLVMPRADTSLHSFIRDAGGPLSAIEALPILSDICDALADIDGHIVHRDLKPKNVLLLHGQWCLADFGIARYTDAATATNTWKGAATAAYAAPERWRGERATTATDVYSLGVIAFEILMGHLPFEGGQDEVRDAHLHCDPPSADAAGPALAAIIDECLFKAPEARPSPATLRRRMDRAATAFSSTGVRSLLEANSAEVDRQAEIARTASVRRTAHERLDLLGSSGRRLMNPMIETLLSAIETAAPTSAISRIHDGPWLASLNGATLSISKPVATSFESHLPFAVCLASEIEVVALRSRSVYRGRSHSLWYCDAQAPGSFSWFETAFMTSPLLSTPGEIAPFAQSPNVALDALRPVIGANQVAWPFTPLEVGSLDDFVDRWAGWFASASLGRLEQPSPMPERATQDTWRR